MSFFRWLRIVTAVIFALPFVGIGVWLSLLLPSDEWKPLQWFDVPLLVLGAVCSYTAAALVVLLGLGQWPSKWLPGVMTKPAVVAALIVLAILLSGGAWILVIDHSLP